MYLLHILVKDEMQIGMITFLPSVQNVREKGRVIDFIIDEIFSKCIQISFEIVRLDEFVMIIERYNHVLWIASDVNHL